MSGITWVSCHDLPGCGIHRCCTGCWLLPGSWVWLYLLLTYWLSGSLSRWLSSISRVVLLLLARRRLRQHQPHQQGRQAEISRHERDAAAATQVRTYAHAYPSRVLDYVVA